MIDFNFLKKIVNTKYFNLPCKKLKSKITSLKYNLNYMEISPNGGELFLCNKTSQFDELFLSNSITDNFVILKDEVVQSIYDNTISFQEKLEIAKEAKSLKNLSTSIVMFPEKHKTVFGDFSNLNETIIKFILSLNMNIKFINIIGSYFLNPVWTDKVTACDTKLEYKFQISLEEQNSLSEQELIEKINKYIPSSASVYAKKFPIYLRSNNCAEYLERIIYACPHCNKFLTLFSEHNCVKCNNCGSAFEISRINAEISLTRTFTSLDEAKSFQLGLLHMTEFDYDKPIVTYDNIKLSYDESPKSKGTDVKFSIFPEKIEYIEYENKNEISFFDIYEIYLSDNNTLFITSIDLNKDEINFIKFRGTKRENLYLLVDLFDLFEERHNFK